MAHDTTPTPLPDWTILTACARLQQEQFTTATTVWDIWLRTMETMQESTSAYMRLRMAQNTELMQKLLACHSPAEAAEEQRKYAEASIEAVREQSERLTKLTNSGIYAIAREARGGERPKAVKLTTAA